MKRENSYAVVKEKDDLLDFLNEVRDDFEREFHYDNHIDYKKGLREYTLKRWNERARGDSY